MDANNIPGSSWGQGENELDIRALRRYRAVLAKGVQIGEVMVFAMLPGLIIGVAWLFTQTNFEDAIFYDGTNITCVLNGETGAIKNVQ